MTTTATRAFADPSRSSTSGGMDTRFADALRYGRQASDKLQRFHRTNEDAHIPALSENWPYGGFVLFSPSISTENDIMRGVATSTDHKKHYPFAALWDILSRGLAVGKIALHPDTAKEFSEIDEESKEESFPPCSPQTKNMARTMLEMMHRILPAYYAVYPTADGEIEIQTAKYGGMDISVSCNADGVSDCIVVLRGDCIAFDKCGEKGETANPEAFQDFVRMQIERLKKYAAANSA